MSYLYFIQEFPSKYIKIGKSKDPKGRLWGLRTGNPHLIELIATIQYENDKYAHKAETKSHNYYTKYNIKGEWFKNLPGHYIGDINQLTNGGEIKYYTSMYHTIDWGSTQLYTSTPVPLRIYKKALRTFKQLQDIAKASGDVKELQYIEKFRPVLIQHQAQSAGEFMRNKKEQQLNNLIVKALNGDCEALVAEMQSRVTLQKESLARRPLTPPIESVDLNISQFKSGW